MHLERWVAIADMAVARSQAAVCRMNDNEIFVFGGYSRDKSTLDSIERYQISENRWETLSLKIPIPLRRFLVARVAKNVALILGGLTKGSRESQKVFKYEYERGEMTDLENLEKGGVIENEVLVDNEGFMHIFLEHANGTSPHSHIK